MPSIEERASELIAEITAAFIGVSREGGISLHETRVEDDLGSEEEPAIARAKDVDTDWQEVPYADIEKNDLSMSFFDPIGFRYYLPVYMIWEIRQLAGTEWTDCNTHGAAVFSLRIEETERMREWRRPYFEILSNEQSRAIYKFLLFCTEFSDDFDKVRAQEAIDKYWVKFR